MPLVDLHLPPDLTLPPDIREFLREADRRIERYRQEYRPPAFVPSDFAAAYAALRALEAADIAPGRWFCEWGSGFGVTACLAALLGFEACGIETENELVEAARRLAEDFDIPVQFVRGNFLPTSALNRADDLGEFSWLATDGPCGYEALSLDPEDFAVIYAYPWPDEERFTAEVFDRCAGAGAVLATFHGGDVVRLRQKTARTSRRRAKDRPL